MRYILIVALGVLAFAVLEPAEASAQEARVTADLNVRTGPGTRYGRIGVIPAGAPVDIINCGSGWCRVRYGGLVGYVSDNYLTSGGYAYAPPPVYAPAPRFYSFSFGIGSNYYRPRRHWRHNHWRWRHHDRWDNDHWRYRRGSYRGSYPGGIPRNRFNNPNIGPGQR